eukprot:RCo048178
MDDGADVGDRVLVHAVGGGVCDHQAGQGVAVLLRASLQVGQIHVAAGIALHHNKLHGSHHCRGWVGPVRADRDEAHVALCVTPGAVVCHDAPQPVVLPLSPGVALHAAGLEPRDRAESLLKLGDELAVACGLVRGHEGVQAAELLPRDRQDRRGPGELHRAASQGDHCRVQPQVPALQAVQVPLHLHFAVVAVENGVSEVRGGAAEGSQDVSLRGLCRVLRRLRGHSHCAAASHGDLTGRLCSGGLQEVAHIVLAGRLIQGNGHRVLRKLAQVVPPREAPRNVLVGGDPLKLDLNGVKEDLAHHRVAASPQTLRKCLSKSVDLSGNALEALRPVVHRVHRGHVGQQGLGGADIAGGLLPLDVLLSGLQSHTEGRVALSVAADPNDPAGDQPLQRVRTGQKGGMGPTKSRRHPKALSRAHREVRAEFTRRFQQAQGQQVRHHHTEGLGLLRLCEEGGVVPDLPCGVGVLHAHSAQPGVLLELEGQVVPHHDLHP